MCKKSDESKFKYLYSEETSILEKIEKIAKEIYKAKGIEVDEKIKEQINKIETGWLWKISSLYCKNSI